MGGGRQCLQSNTSNSEADPIDTWSCRSHDGRDLINDWLEDKKKRGYTAQLISNNEDLNDLNLNSDFTLGKCILSNYFLYPCTCSFIIFCYMNLSVTCN